MSINKKLQHATFRGGTTFKEVNSILDEHGLAMSMLGSISDQTVAGAIATGNTDCRSLAVGMEMQNQSLYFLLPGFACN